jgi:hypothetical protein
VDDGSPCKQTGGDELAAVAILIELVATYGLGPYGPAGLLDQLQGRTLQLDSPGGKNRHARAQVRHILDNVGGENNDDILADLRQQVQKSVALFRVEPRSGFIDDDQVRIADQRLSDTESLAHSTREAGDCLVAHSPEIGLVQQCLDSCLAVCTGCYPFEHAHMFEHVIGGNAGVDAEILWQIAKPAAQRLGVGDDVDVAELDRSACGRLQGCNGPHQGRLAGAVRAEKPVHALGYGKRDIIERPRAVGIDMGDIGELEHVTKIPRVCRTGGTS